MNLKLAWSVMADAFSKWNEHKAIRLGAALAYFGIFAIAPVLIIAIGIAGLVYGQAATEGNLVRSISGVVGSSTAQFAQDLVESVSHPGAGVIAVGVGIAGIVLGSAGFFFQLRDALNTVWEVAPKPGYGFLDMIRDNTLSFAMAVGLGVLLLASLLLSAGVSAVGSLFGSAGRRDGLAACRHWPVLWRGSPAVCLHLQDLTGCQHLLGRCVAWSNFDSAALHRGPGNARHNPWFSKSRPGVRRGGSPGSDLVVDQRSLADSLVWGGVYLRLLQAIRLACSTQDVCRGAHTGSESGPGDAGASASRNQRIVILRASGDRLL